MVFSAGPLELALQDADRFRVIVDALDDGCLIFHAQPATRCEAPHGFSGFRHPLQESVVVLDVVPVVVFGQDFIRVLEVQHEVHANFGIGFVEPIEHGQKRVVKPLWVEGHLLGAHTNGFNSCFRQCAEPSGEFGVVEHHGVAAGEQDFSKLLASTIGMSAAVGFHFFVELFDVRHDFRNLGQTLLGFGAILTLNFFAGDQLFAVAEAAVGRAG